MLFRVQSKCWKEFTTRIWGISSLDFFFPSLLTDTIVLKSFCSSRQKSLLLRFRHIWGSMHFFPHAKIRKKKKKRKKELTPVLFAFSSSKFQLLPRICPLFFLLSRTFNYYFCFLEFMLLSVVLSVGEEHVWAYYG